MGFLSKQRGPILQALCKQNTSCGHEAVSLREYCRTVQTDGKFLPLCPSLCFLYYNF